MKGPIFSRNALVRLLVLHGRSCLRGCLFFLLVTAGCTTPPLEHPAETADLPFNSTWSATEGYPGAVVLDFRDGWLKDFDDPSLAEYVREVVQYNYDLRAAAARLAQARHEVTIVGADRQLQVSGSSDALRSKNSGGGSPNNDFSITLDLSWDLDLWGRLKNHYYATVADWEAAQEDFRAARLSLAAQAARTWLNAIEAELQVRMAQKNADNFARNNDLIAQRYERGLSAALDLRLSRSDEANARATLNLRQQERDAAGRALEVLLGRYPANAFTFTERMPNIQRPIPAGLPAELLQRRPDIRAAEQRVISAQQRVSEARKAFLPDIQLTGSAGMRGEELENLLNSNFSIWSIASGIVQPLFQGRRLTGQWRRAKEVVLETVANYGEIALQAFEEVETALAAEHFLIKQLEFIVLAKEEAIGAEHLAWQQYRKGLIDIVTLLEAERRAFEARSQYVSVSNQRAQNRISLYLALGGDFDTIANLPEEE